MSERTQITLDPELQKRARRKAADLGISFAEYIRRLVARDVSAPRKLNDPSVLFALGGSGGSDIARDKDEMVARAFAAARARRRPKRPKRS
jgi:hypothetical protein